MIDTSNPKRYFYFRALTVFEYDTDTKRLDIGTEAFMCSFITEDFKLMSEFLMQCYNNVKNGTEVKTIEVD